MAFNKAGFVLNARHSLPFINQTFIHVRCIDEQGKALAGRPYQITLPDGQLVRGKLDADGWAKHDGIKPGECVFKLLDPKPSGPDQPGGLHFINVVVKDEDGRPLVGEPFVLGIGDGTVRRGELDAEGRCLQERLPGGPCFFALRGNLDSKAKNARHLRLQFMDEDGEPFAKRPFQIKVGDQVLEGITSDDGRVIADVPGDLDDGELTIWVDEDKSGESYTWPIRISEVARAK
ncbi:MAG: hypothetical protein AB7N76_24660 [Planctomycetota bacterium]